MNLYMTTGRCKKFKNEDLDIRDDVKLELFRKLVLEGKFFICVEVIDEENIVLQYELDKFKVKSRIYDIGFVVGDQVKLKESTEKEVFIYKIDWHGNKKVPIYYLTIDGKKKTKRYFLEDFIL